MDQIFTLTRYPAEDEELRAESMTRQAGGNACNSAQILAQLGFKVELISSMAQDADAQWLLQHLTEHQISTRLCQHHPSASTPQSTIWLNQRNGSRTIVHYRELPELDLDHLQQLETSAYQWIHFEGRNVDSLLQYLPQLAATGVTISLEMEKNRPQLEALLPFVDTVIVSRDYLQQTGSSAEALIDRLQRNNPGLSIVCTLGQAGSIASDSPGNIIKTEAESLSSVVDTRGAGDCFIAGLISQLVEDADFPSALSFANQLAANKIGQKGMNINV